MSGEELYTEDSRDDEQKRGEIIARAQTGINIIRTADAALGEIQTTLGNMRAVAAEAASDATSAAGREKMQGEIEGMIEDIDRIADKTRFEGKRLLDGTFGEHFSVLC